MTAAVFFIAGFENCGAANAATLYDVFSERHLEFYENEVAKEKVFSKYSERELGKSQKTACILSRDEKYREELYNIRSGQIIKRHGNFRHQKVRRLPESDKVKGGTCRA